MAILIKSNTPDSDKDFWATTWQAFSDAEALYGRKFQVDVAAEASTAKCPSYSDGKLADAILAAGFSLRDK